jgi:hypothetical protein
MDVGAPGVQLDEAPHLALRSRGSIDNLLRAIDNLFLTSVSILVR